MNSITAAIGVFAIAIAIVVPLVLWNGFVVHLMWLWFVVPLGVPAIGVIHATGFSLFIALFRPIRGDDDKKWWKALGNSLARSALVLAIGYVAKSWM